MNIDYTGMFEKVAAPGLGGPAGWGAMQRGPGALGGTTVRQIPSLPGGIAKRLKSPTWFPRPQKPDLSAQLKGTKATVGYAGNANPTQFAHSQPRNYFTPGGFNKHREQAQFLAGQKSGILGSYGKNFPSFLPPELKHSRRLAAKFRTNQPVQAASTVHSFPKDSVGKLMPRGEFQGMQHRKAMLHRLERQEQLRNRSHWQVFKDNAQHQAWKLLTDKPSRTAAQSALSLGLNYFGGNF